MGDYTKGKFYKIVPYEIENESDIYIGSTTKEYLSQRMATHKVGCLHWKRSSESYLSIFYLFEKYGIDNCKIILLENVCRVFNFFSFFLSPNFPSRKNSIFKGKLGK